MLRSLHRFDDAAVEYTEAIRLRPREFASHDSLGNSYAAMGQWKKAAAAFEGAAGVSPNDVWPLYRGASLRFYAGDLENYRRACSTMLDRFGQTGNAQAADCIVKACVLTPDLGGNAQQIMKLADLAMAGTEAAPERKGFEITQGLVLYRARRFGPAAESIIRSSPMSEGAPRDALAFAVLAMARHRLGQLEDAHAALTSAQRIVSAKLPNLAKGETFGDDWCDWLHCQVLCREAGEMLREEPHGMTQHSTAPSLREVPPH